MLLGRELFFKQAHLLIISKSTCVAGMCFLKTNLHLSINIYQGEETNICQDSYLKFGRMLSKRLSLTA